MKFFSNAIVLSGLALLAAAAPNYPAPTTTITVTAQPTATTISQCNTSDVKCCNSVGPATSQQGVGAIVGKLGLVLQDVSVSVGLGCTPIDILGGGICSQTPVCCSNNQFDGLINIGCVPITL